MNRRSFIATLAAIPAAFIGAFRNLSTGSIGWGKIVTPTSEIHGGLPRVGDTVNGRWGNAEVIHVSDDGWASLRWRTPEGFFGYANERRDDWSDDAFRGYVADLRIWEDEHA